MIFSRFPLLLARGAVLCAGCGQIATTVGGRPSRAPASAIGGSRFKLCRRGRVRMRTILCRAATIGNVHEPRAGSVEWVTR